jgi:hypothetical protein
MTLSTKYQEFVRQQIKQVGSLEFDRDIIFWRHTNGGERLGILETGNTFSTPVSCMNDSACRFCATIALVIPMTAL